MRIDACIVVAVRQSAGSLTLKIDAGRLTQPETLGILDHLLAAHLDAGPLKVRVIRESDRVIEFAAGRSIADRAVLLIDYVLIQSRDTGDEFDG